MQLGKIFFTVLATLIITLQGMYPSIAQVSQQQPPKPASADNISRNWSGYSATGASFTAVSATWSIPKIASTNTFSADATWVGIGGVESTDLIQAGTQGMVDGSGDVSYEAFYETLPDISQPLQVSVKDGDSVSVEVSQESPGKWNVSFVNNTSGEKDHVIVTYDSSLSSAEWIEEAPSGMRQVYPLDNFGKVAFTKAATVENGKKLSLSQTHPQSIAMSNSFGENLTATSEIATSGDSFQVTRLNDTVTPALRSIFSQFPFGRFTGRGRHFRRFFQ